MKVVSVITEFETIKQILQHLGLLDDHTGQCFRESENTTRRLRQQPEGSGPPVPVESKLPDEIEYVPDEYAWPEPEYT